MSAETLTAIAAALLSLGCSYVPGLSDWYGRLGTQADGSGDGGRCKRLVMLGLLALTAVGAFGLACSGVGAGLGLGLTCDPEGVAGLGRALALAAAANQGTYWLTGRR